MCTQLHDLKCFRQLSNDLAARTVTCIASSVQLVFCHSVAQLRNIKLFYYCPLLVSLFPSFLVSFLTSSIGFSVSFVPSCLPSCLSSQFLPFLFVISFPSWLLSFLSVPKLPSSVGFSGSFFLPSSFLYFVLSFLCFFSCYCVSISFFVLFLLSLFNSFVTFLPSFLPSPGSMFLFIYFFLYFSHLFIQFCYPSSIFIRAG